MNCGRSKSGQPILTENGGGATNTGSATCIAGPNGEKVKPLLIPKGYSQGDHAIFVAKAGIGMVVAEAEHSRRGESVSVRRIVTICADDDPERPNWVELSGPIYEWENGDGTGDETFYNVARAALDKSHCYHCREPHFYARNGD